MTNHHRPVQSWIHGMNAMRPKHAHPKPRRQYSSSGLPQDSLLKTTTTVQTADVRSMTSHIKKSVEKYQLSLST